MMMLTWSAEFDPLRSLWICTAAILLLLTLIPGVFLMYRGIFHRSFSREQIAGWLLLLALGSIAWNVGVYSLAFGPSAGMFFEETRSDVPLDMETMLRQESQTEDNRHLIGRGGWIGNLEFAFFRTLTPQGNPEEPLFSTRRPHITLPHVAFLFYQMMIFLTAISLLAVLLLLMYPWPLAVICSVLWGAVVYAPMAHWVWGDGWLGLHKAVDAGAGILHLTAGFSALAVLLFGGKTLPESHPESASSEDSLLKSDQYAAIGLLLFLTGSLVLHSTRGMQSAVLPAGVLLNSHLAACMGLVTWCLLSQFRGRRFTISDAILGALSGLATISAGSALMVPSSAVICGLIGGTAGYASLQLSSKWTENRFAAIMFSAQGIPAAIGLILVGLFAYAGLGAKHWDGTAIAGLVDGDITLLKMQSILACCMAMLAVTGTALLLIPTRFAASRLLAHSANNTTATNAHEEGPTVA